MTGRSEKQDTEYHTCGLPGEPFDIVSKYIEGGIFVELRRTLKRYTMISKSHPQTRAYAPSLYRIKQEEKAHMVLHYNMFHPLSMFNLHFELFTSITLIIHFIIAPVVFANASTRQKTMLMMPIHVTYIFIILVSFNTGYYDRSQNIIYMDRKKVAIHYILTYFIFDLLSFPPEVIRLSQMKINQHAYAIAAPIMVVLRYGRFIWSMNVLKRIRRYYGFSTFSFQFLKLLLNLIVGLELAIYLLFRILSTVKFFHLQRFLLHSEATLKMLLLVSHGRNLNLGILLEVTLSTVFLIIGFVFHLVILTETMEIWFRFFSEENQQAKVYRSINAYMRYRALPITLRNRMYLYLQFKYQGHFYKDSVIRRATSHFLREEILLAATKESIQKVDLFAHMPRHLLKKIRSILVAEIFLPGDVIIKAGTAGKCMFFLLAGTVLVSTPEDKEICLLRDGTHFGEVALVINIARVANVTAMTPCELFRLDRQNFMDIVSKYPNLWRRIEKMAIERVAAQLRTSQTRLNIEVETRNPSLRESTAP